MNQINCESSLVLTVIFATHMLQYFLFTKRFCIILAMNQSKVVVTGIVAVEKKLFASCENNFIRVEACIAEEVEALVLHQHIGALCLNKKVYGSYFVSSKRYSFAYSHLRPSSLHIQLLKYAHVLRMIPNSK